MKTCPFCAEQIQDAAVVCKHCSRDVPAILVVTPTQKRHWLVRFWRYYQRSVQQLTHGPINSAIMCKQCRVTGQVHAKIRVFGSTKAFCGNCRTRWEF